MKITQYDVVVVGGGPGGVGAAVAAGRSGAKALLLEREGCLGGGATTMLVNPFMPYTTGDGKVVCGGVFQEVLGRLKSRGAADPKDARGFDDEALKLVLDELVAQAGVDVIYHAALFDAQVQDGRAQSIRLAHNHGPITVAGKVFIDSTGDALLAALCGCEIQFGNESGRVMPMTLFFKVEQVDTARIPSGRELYHLAAKGDKDQPPLINTNFSCLSSPLPGVVYINAIRVPGNTLDPFSVSQAESEGRRRVENYVAWLRANVPGYGNCRLAKTASHVGIRESRRVTGDYVLTADDFKKCSRFDDAVACCSYMVDIHGDKPGEGTILHLPPDGYYQVPYRCLTPRGMKNLLVASRSISTDVTMHSSVRIMPQVMNLGEAAGCAAAMALPDGDIRSIDIRGLQDRIRAGGGILEPREQA